jgi:5-formyltetrahydrofolate cyclo-ligase
MSTWPAVREWRTQTRTEMLSRLSALSSDEQSLVRTAVCASLLHGLRDRLTGCVGLYWPFLSEVNLWGLYAEINGVEFALPVMVGKDAPLEFWLWRPGSKLLPGLGNFPAPATRRPMRPITLFIPLLGFDVAGYRLGYGGGAYDRTLGSLSPKPLTVGVGYECTRLATIHPQPHDVPMDVIITESRFQWCSRHHAPVRSRLP